MEIVFSILVGFLLLLACIDLFVGVSNDAVNFLNSAVGCRIAPMKVILIVASAGVLFGATFSSGMMEVARKGVFRPELFTFYEILFIFCAVVISDVLLLNIFNSLGLPTSTTVSIVFELLGAAVCAAAFKLHSEGVAFSEIFEYIKTDRATTIVSAILSSVVVAFFAGALVQFILRLFFSFRFQRVYLYLGGVFCGLSVTSIVYFLVMKGAKGSSFMKLEYIDFINNNTSTLLWGFFIFFTIMGQVMVLMKKNVFKVIILLGTFSLAFSFAGNDLVNFVGVPLAALDSLMTWFSAGHPEVHSMTMDALNSDAGTPTIFLLMSGLIMVITLWVSRKAHAVLQTSINLSSSSQGVHEQFGASAPGRVVTRVGLGVSRAIHRFMPAFMLAFVGSRYVKPPVVKGEVQLPFDYVRASVNLVLASILIASATSLKLPLSTTYVTFMVAMGTSFADGAWSRESAVYRISGVITVIAGWFLTAMSAFIFATTIALLFFSTGYVAIMLMMCLAIFVVVRTNFFKRQTSETTHLVIQAGDDNQKIFTSVSQTIPMYFDRQLEVVDRVLANFFNDNEFKLRRDFNKASNIEDELSKVRSEYYSLALEQNTQDANTKLTSDTKHFFYLTFSNMREASKAIRFMTERAVTHVANRHTIFQGEMQYSLMELTNRLHLISQALKDMTNDMSAGNVENVVKLVKKLNRDIDRSQLDMVNIIGYQHVSMHSSEMYMAFMQGLRDMANRYVAITLMERALSQLLAGANVDKAMQNAQMRSQVFGTTVRTDSEDIILSNDDEDKEAIVKNNPAAAAAIAAVQAARAEEKAAVAAAKAAAAERAVAKAATEAASKADNIAAAAATEADNAATATSAEVTAEAKSEAETETRAEVNGEAKSEAKPAE